VVEPEEEAVEEAGREVVEPVELARVDEEGREVVEDEEEPVEEEGPFEAGHMSTK
jgi:hypothetical protein